MEEVEEEGSVLVIRRKGAAELIDADDSFMVIKVKDTDKSKNDNSPSHHQAPSIMVIPEIS